MRRAWKAGMVMIGLLTPAAAAAQVEPAARAVVERAVEAMGGEAALRGVERALVRGQHRLAGASGAAPGVGAVAHEAGELVGQAGGHGLAATVGLGPRDGDARQRGPRRRR